MNPNIDLSNRVQRLLVRLELDIPASLVDLGIRIGSILIRGNYFNLFKAGIITVEQFENASEDILLTCFENNHEKFQQVKLALVSYRLEEATIVTLPILPPYEG